MGKYVQPTRPLHAESTITFGMFLLVEEPLGEFSQKFGARGGDWLAT